MCLSLLGKVLIHNNEEVTDFHQSKHGCSGALCSSIKIYQLQDKFRNSDSLVHKTAHVYSNEQPDSNKVMMTQSLWG